MAVQQDLVAITGNDEVYNLAITYQGAPLPLAGYTLTAYLKASRTAADSTATLFTVGAGLTITDSVNGKVTLAIGHAALPNPRTMWWRIDLADGSGNVTTAIYGNVQVLPA